MTPRFLAVLAVFAAIPAAAAAQAPPPPLASPGVAAPGLGAPLADPNRCAPQGLFRAVVRNVTPGLQAADRGAQLRTLFRSGALFMRTEEEPDTMSGDQNIVIVAEPDIWVLNVPSRRGRHSRDPGPELAVHAPILPVTFDTPGPFRSLEFGCESDFVGRVMPRPQRLVSWGGIVASFHQATIGEHTVIVLMNQRSNAPLMISYAKQGKPVLVLRYQEYRIVPTEQPQLFTLPKGYQITEARDSGPGAAPLN